MINPPDQLLHSEIILYQTEDGKTRIDVRLEGETVWLTQKITAELFQKDVRTINEHIQNIFDEKELEPDSVIRKFRITAADSKPYQTRQYNLDMIISVGYRIQSHRGTQFRIWATQRSREYGTRGQVWKSCFLSGLREFGGKDWTWTNGVRATDPPVLGAKTCR